MSKDLFLEMRENQFFSMTDKELTAQAQQAANEISEQQREDEALKYAIKMKKYIESLEKVVRKTLQDRINDSFYSPHIEVKEQSRTTLDYEQDPEYSRIKNELNIRKQLLDAAHNAGRTGNVIVDADGVEVPIVPIKSGSSYLVIKVK